MVVMADNRGAMRPGKTGRPSNTKKPAGDTPIHPLTSFVLCFAVLLGTAFFALQQANPDQGRVLTTTQMNDQIAYNTARIQSDPRIPQQAKAIALRMMQSRPQRHDLSRPAR